MKTATLFRTKTVFSFEVFPPKKTMGIETIYNTLDELKGLNPDFISVTYGAGGSNNCTATLDIASRIKTVCKVEAVVHLPCIYLSRAGAEDVLSQFKDAGIENILALRGDKIDDRPPMGDFIHASDLISYIKDFDERCPGKKFNILGACYPEKHPESVDIISDIRALKSKTDAGADHLISQLFFDNALFYRFLERARLGGIAVPIEAGIMQVVNKKQIERITTICGAALPDKFRRILDRYGDSPEALRDAGIAYAVDQIVDLVTQGVQGIHLYTMNNAYVARRISEAVRSLFQIKTIKDDFVST